MGFTPAALGPPAVITPTSSAKDFPPTHGSSSSSSSYLRMQHDPVTGEGDSLVMSPKKLQVETRSPYSKAVTSIQSSKSSMV